jgi:hypothetical protein
MNHSSTRLAATLIADRHREADLDRRRQSSLAAARMDRFNLGRLAAKVRGSMRAPDRLLGLPSRQR